MNLNFENKVIIVTGASSGIGAETAKIFAQKKERLCLIGRNEMRLHNVARQCEEMSGHEPVCILCDLTHPGSCEKVVRETVDKFSRIDVLINCAGKIKMASMYDHNMEIFDELIAINLRVPYYLTQLALPHLIRTKGNVVNVGSSYLNRYTPGFLPFMVSKCALEKFSEYASMEVVTDGVRVNVVSPAVTRTNFLRDLNIDESSLGYAYEEIASNLTTKKILEPREVAKAIYLAASDSMPNMTGANLRIDAVAVTTD